MQSTEALRAVVFGAIGKFRGDVKVSPQGRGLKPTETVNTLIGYLSGPGFLLLCDSN